MGEEDFTTDKLRQRNFEATTFSYLKRHYFDPKRLWQRTWDEFVQAMRTGRMIAFTGSMATEDRGYEKWDEFAKFCFARAETIFKEYNSEENHEIAELAKIVSLFARESEKKKSKLDKRVGFSVIGETVDLANYYTRSNEVNPNKVIGNDLFLHRTSEKFEDANIIQALLKSLSIDRCITLNYDFELELEYADREFHRDPRGQHALEALGFVEHDPITGQIVKRLTGARSLVSDIFNRDRSDRLFEFAVGSPDHEYHVLHLHGRADAFDSMVVSYRDYDRLYRRSGLSKAPFEHALRLLYAGNPILFVGLGMGEAEINATLQDFVGDHPYRRITPTFLLWNSWRTEDEKEVDQDRCDIMRIDMLHRLGVLTIFDHELAEDFVLPAAGDRAEDLSRVRRSIENLAAKLSREEERRANLIPSAKWRSMTARGGSAERIISTWAIAGERKAAASPPLVPLPHGMTLVAERSGRGKGGGVNPTADAWLEANAKGQVLVLNAEFCFDTDSLLNLLSVFLRAHYDPARQAALDRISRGELFQRDDAFILSHSRPVLIVVSGTERLFGTNGEPLSAEFDDMLRGYVRSLRYPHGGTLNCASLLIYGTPRNESYFRGLFGGVDPALFVVPPGDPSVLNYEPSRYLKRVEGHLAQGGPKRVVDMILEQKRSPSFELHVFRRAFFAAYLEPKIFERAGLPEDHGNLAADLLTVMAYIGQPVEQDVLFLAPRVQQRLNLFRDKGDLKQIFRDTLAWLAKVALVIPIEPYAESPAKMQRYGLHATLLSELRERAGVPLSEAVLSTAFNMSLYAAQPTDGPLPEASLHDELGQLIDWMIGAYRDTPFNDDQPQTGRGRPDAVAALRAAQAIIRGFYSTTALLSIEEKDRRVVAERDGALTEHAERLERLLFAFRKSLDHVPENHPGAFYPDEIVWLYNEIGVVRLAQGSLYDARFAFDEAERYNREYVEFDDKGHNWRRITLNQIIVDIERARFDSAERRIKIVEDLVSKDKQARIEQIMALPGPIPPDTDALVSHEEMLSIGLVNGYRGICAHVAGETIDASHYYKRAIDILRRLDERRAFATFQRHYASLTPEGPGADGREAALDLAIASAESVRQMDLVHHGRIQRSHRLSLSRNVDDWSRANRQLMETLTYADATDMYRVRVEARAKLAEARMASGDNEVALEHASDALAVATRYGLSLRKITLRILIGRILIRRGDPQSGRALIESGKAAAGRIGYQRAIAMAQTALTMDGRIA